jgi:uncharacterized protein YqiB (DUF1249 family)
MTRTRESEAKIRLADLHGHCELNYVRLMRLCPEMRIMPRREFRAGDRQQFSLQLEVTERCAYTTMIKLGLSMDGLRWAGFQNIQVRIYHDARMAEVVECDEQRVGLIRYTYPNRSMYQPDEKMQLNQFLGVWLDYFLARGCRSDKSPAWIPAS